MKRAMLLLIAISLSITFLACTEDEPSLKLMSKQFNDLTAQGIAKEAGLPVFASGEVVEILDKYKDGDKTVMSVKTRTTMTMSSQELKEKAVETYGGDRFSANIASSMVIDAFGGGWDKGFSVEEEGDLVFAKTDKSWKLLDIKQ